MEKIKTYAKAAFDGLLGLVREHAGYATWLIVVLAVLVVIGAF